MERAEWLLVSMLNSPELPSKLSAELAGLSPLSKSGWNKASFWKFSEYLLT